MRDKKRGAMIELTRSRVTITSGVASDFRGKPGSRQVTVLAQEGWLDACREIGRELPWVTRRANLYIDGIDLQASKGRILQIGQMQLLVTRETDPCERMSEACDGLCEALAKAWRGGVCCRVIHDGEVSVGDKVEMLDVKS